MSELMDTDRFVTIVLCVVNNCDYRFYRVFQKSSHPKTFWNIFSSVRSFCVKFCTFVGSSYPHIPANFLYSYLNISSNGVNFFHKYPSLSPCQVLSRPIHPENENAAFRK